MSDCEISAKFCSPPPLFTKILDPQPGLHCVVIIAWAQWISILQVLDTKSTVVRFGSESSLDGHHHRTEKNVFRTKCSEMSSNIWIRYEKVFGGHTCAILGTTGTPVLDFW